jgi:plasmid stabilization system protein ParE
VDARAFRFHPAAEEELEEAAGWYEERQAGLGADFIGAVRSKIGMILEAPGRWAIRSGTRRVLLGQFPYAIVYRELGDEVEIVAVAHLRRRPTYWSKR